MKIVSIVPIKFNSERLPFKNIKFLDGKPMIDYILTTIDKTDLIDKNYVFCSNEDIKKYLKNHPKTQFLKRKKELDSSKANFTEIFSSFIKKINADIYVFTHATAPLIKPETINLAIKKVLFEGYDSAFTVKKENNFYWIDGLPNYCLSPLPRTQDLKPIYLETSGVYVFKKSVFENGKTRVGKNPFLIELDDFQDIDVDEEKDFIIADLLIKYLNKKK